MLIILASSGIIPTVRFTSIQTVRPKTDPIGTTLLALVFFAVGYLLGYFYQRLRNRDILLLAAISIIAFPIVGGTILQVRRACISD